MSREYLLEYKKLGINVKKFREHCGLTKGQLAVFLGENAKYVEALEEGLMRISLDRLFLLRDILGVQIEDFFYASPKELRECMLRNFPDTIN